MSFTDYEQTLFHSLRENPVGYPFSLNDTELDQAIHAIKRERGNEEAKARRAIRVYVANKFGWGFAMDGGFMPKEGQTGWSDKYWQDSMWPVSMIYQLFENLVLYLLSDNWTMGAIDEAINQICSDSTCLNFKKEVIGVPLKR